MTWSCPSLPVVAASSVELYRIHSTGIWPGRRVHQRQAAWSEAGLICSVRTRDRLTRWPATVLKSCTAFACLGPQATVSNQLAGSHGSLGKPRITPGRWPGGRLHIHGIKEMPAGYDAEVAELFRDLRSASGLTEADLAAQLATRTEVVQALEQGALYALPPWPETYRVVATYGTLLNLDVRPLLRRIYAQVDAGVVGLAPKSMPDVPFMAPPENVEREYQNQAPQAGPPAGEAFPSPPQQPAPPPQRAPQPAPDRRAPPRPPQPPQSPQMRPQSQPQAQPSPRQPQPHLRHSNGRRSKEGRPPRHRERRLSRRRCRAPANPHRRPREGPWQARNSLKPSPQLTPRGALPLEDKPPQKAWPWKALVKWGVVTLVVLGIAAGLWMWLAKPDLLGSGNAPGEPGAKSNGRANRPQRSAEPKGRSPSRPLIASPDLLDSST